MKKFTKEGWINCLTPKGWEKIGETEDVEEMAKNFTETMQEALDEYAPIKKFKINTSYKQGLMEVTKKMIKERRPKPFPLSLSGMLGVKAKCLHTYLQDLTGGMVWHDGYLTTVIFVSSRN